MQTRSRTLAVRALSAVDASPFRHLGVDELRELFVGKLDQDDVFAFACACRLFHAATCQRGSPTARFPSGVRTRRRAAWVSVARLRWAVMGLGYRMTRIDFARAAGEGRPEVLQWARANGCEWYEFTCTFAARGGHLEVLQWARANGCK